MARGGHDVRGLRRAHRGGRQVPGQLEGAALERARERELAPLRPTALVFRRDTARLLRVARLTGTRDADSKFDTVWDSKRARRDSDLSLSLSLSLVFPAPRFSRELADPVSFKKIRENETLCLKAHRREVSRARNKDARLSHRDQLSKFEKESVFSREIENARRFRNRQRPKTRHRYISVASFGREKKGRGDELRRRGTAPRPASNRQVRDVQFRSLLRTPVRFTFPIWIVYRVFKR